MTAAHEPRLARVAALLADPARSRMLAYLLSGEYATAGELARVASVSPATASGHLGKLLDAAILACEPRGRHRYYKLHNADVAHALQALALVAERQPHDRVWAHPERQRLRWARCCYGHLAGTCAVALFETLLHTQGLHSKDGGWDLTDSGRQWLLQNLGFSTTAAQGRRRFAYPCLDWSERRDHLAGELADQIYQHCTQAGWLRRSSGRAVEVTPRGVLELLPKIGVAAP